MSASHPSPSLLDFARWFQIADPEGAVAEYIAKRGEFQRCRTCVGAGRLFCEQDRTCYDDSPPIAARSPAPSDEPDHSLGNQLAALQSRDFKRINDPRAAPSVEARDATLLGYPLRVDSSIPADELRFIANGQIVGVIRLAPASLLPPETP